MDPVLSGRGDSVGVAALLDELLHTAHRLLGKHVQQQADDRGGEDDCDRDGHCFGGGCWTAEGGCPPLGCGATAPGSTMNVRIAFGFPSYRNCSSGIGIFCVS